MCTIALALRQVPDLPLLVAANRDESALRPARRPFAWEAPIPFLAGRDEEAGGTWMGVSAAGLFVGLTNLWVEGRFRSAPRSRGQVVVDLLAAPDLAQARAILSALDPDEFRPFNVAVADASGQGFAACSAEGLAPRPLGPGVTVVGNLTLSDPGPKVARVKRQVEAALASADGDLFARLGAAMADHTRALDPRVATCVHTPTPYGTVSSTLAALGPREGRFSYAPGPPCVTPYEDLSGLLVELGR